MLPDWSSGPLAEGLACYHARSFFAAHEHWEDAWRACDGPEKGFLQGLIHIAAAFHHLSRGNAVGAERQLRRALRRLEGYAAEFGGVRVAAVQESVLAWARALESGDTAPALPFPPIR
jgi:predicted metal-dependent hydrolase